MFAAQDAQTASRGRQNGDAIERPDSAQGHLREMPTVDQGEVLQPRV
jgi:hypothetical protein